jgi:hypothetical protein
MTDRDTALREAMDADCTCTGHGSDSKDGHALWCEAQAAARGFRAALAALSAPSTEASGEDIERDPEHRECIAQAEALATGWRQAAERESALRLASTEASGEGPFDDLPQRDFDPTGKDRTWPAEASGEGRFDEAWADLLREFPTRRDATVRGVLGKHREALRAATDPSHPTASAAGEPTCWSHRHWPCSSASIPPDPNQALRDIRELIAADWPDEASRLLSIDTIAKSALREPSA